MCETTEERIRSFADLENGWLCAGEGDVFSRQVIESALALHYSMLRHGMTNTYAFPGTHGEIDVLAYGHNGTLTITVYPNETIDYCIELNDIEVDSAENIPLWYQAFLWLDAMPYHRFFAQPPDCSP